LVEHLYGISGTDADFVSSMAFPGRANSLESDRFLRFGLGLSWQNTA
jgi:hypothetical protein